MKISFCWLGNCEGGRFRGSLVSPLCFSCSIKGIANFRNPHSRRKGAEDTTPSCVGVQEDSDSNAILIARPTARWVSGLGWEGLGVGKRHSCYAKMTGRFLWSWSSWPTQQPPLGFSSLHWGHRQSQFDNPKKATQILREDAATILQAEARQDIEATSFFIPMQSSQRFGSC